MTEEVKIKLTSELDSKGYDELRKKLNESRNELNALARATEKGSKEYKTYKESVKEINRIVKLSDADLKKYTQSIIAEEQALKKAEKGLKDVGNETEKTSGKFDNLIKVGIAGGITYLVSQVGNLVQSFGEMAREGAEFQNLYSAFERLNGGIDSANEKLKLLRKASSSNLDDSELIKYTNEMNSLGFATDETAKLLDIADTRSDDLGKTFEQGQTALKDFILSGRELGLKEIGINFVDVREKMEQLTGKTYEQIQSFGESDQQKIRSMAVLDLYGQSVDVINGKLLGTDDKLASIETLTKNVSLLFGVTLANAFETAAGENELFNKELTTTIQDAQKLGKQIGEAYTSIIKFSEGIQDASSWLSPVTTLVYGLYDGLKLITEQTLDFLGVVREIKQEQIDAVNSIVSQLNPDVIDNTVGPDRTEFDRRQKLLNGLGNTRLGTSSNSGSRGVTSTEKQELTYLQDLNKQLSDINDKILKQTEGENFFQKLFGTRKDLEDRIAFINALNSGLDILSVTSTVGTIPNTGTTGINQVDPIQQTEQINESFNKTVEEVDTINTSIVSTMQLFNLGVESGIGQFLNGLTSAVQLIKTLQTVNSILGLIPGFASGGSFTGGSPIMVGEKGAELIFPKNAGYVMNHGDSQRYINQSITSNASPVNVYVNSNIDAMKFFKDEFPKYRNYEKGKRIN